MRNLTVYCLHLAVGVACLAALAQAQPKYTVQDLGALSDFNSAITAINNAGQVGGYTTNGGPQFGFRTVANSAVNQATDDVGTLGGPTASVTALNSSGQAVGLSTTLTAQHGFRTAPNSSINAGTDDVGTLGGTYSAAFGINTGGQVVGYAYITGDAAYHAFRTGPNLPIKPATDDLGTLAGGTITSATGINDSGVVVGYGYDASNNQHGFRTSANSAINPATDDLGTFGGWNCYAAAINTSGQVVGNADVTLDGSVFHAFYTAAGAVGPLVAATDDIGTLGGLYSAALAINTSGQAVGYSATTTDPTTNVNHAFLYTASTMYDLNGAIPAGSGWLLATANGINDSGQITGVGFFASATHAFRLDPVPAITLVAAVQPPIKADGSSVFSNSKGTVPVKFTLSSNGVPTCQLPAATLTVTRTSSPAGVVATGAFSSSSCQYSYNLAGSSLGTGAYRVDISIGSTLAGSGKFSVR